jgi:NhaA family Na+:H+ antiporter
MICVNTDLKSFYDGLQQIPVGIQFGTFQIHKPLLLSINDGLMVQLFFLVGLELKWEVLEGGLSESANVVLPALGGMVIPVCLYWLVNRDHPVGSDDWAIPMATDIAFALGLLSLLGPRLMISLKIFLVSLAIFDDIGAIVVIALSFSPPTSLRRCCGSPVAAWRFSFSSTAGA